MSLLAYNLTAAPLPLAAGAPIVTLPASASAGSRGPAFNVTGELKGQLAPAFALLQAQANPVGLPATVQYEWSALPEFNTFSLVVGSAQTDVSDLPIEVYVDPVGGNDNNPGTPTSKVQTFLKAWSLMAVGRSLRRIYLAAGNYPITGLETFAVPPYLAGGEPVCVLGTPVDSGLGVLTITGTVPSTTGGANRGITAAPHVGNFQGAAILFTSGPVAGRRFLIAEDDGTTFTLANRVNLPANAPIPPGNTFIIERPGSVLVSANGSGFAFTEGACAFKDVKFDMTEGGVVLTFPQNVAVLAMENVEMALENGGGFNVSDGASIRPASFDVPFLSPNPFSLALRQTCGVYAHSDSTGFGAVSRGGVWNTGGLGCHVFLNFDMNVIEGGLFSGGLVYAHYDMRVLIEVAQAAMNGRGSAHSITKGSLFPTSPAIGVTNGSSLELTESDIGLSLGAGVDVSAGGQALLRGNLSLGACAGFGVDLHDSGLATLVQDGAGNSSCEITGTLNAVGDVISGIAPAMTLTSSAGIFTADMVGRFLTLSGWANPANNGTFLITGFLGNTAINYTNNFGVAEISAVGAWLVQADVKVGDLPAVGYVAQLNGTRGLGEIDAVLGPTGNRVNVSTFT
jgi:hypothetical protein